MTRPALWNTSLCTYTYTLLTPTYPTPTQFPNLSWT